MHARKRNCPCKKGKFDLTLASTVALNGTFLTQLLVAYTCADLAFLKPDTSELIPLKQALQKAPKMDILPTTKKHRIWTY